MVTDANKNIHTKNYRKISYVYVRKHNFFGEGKHRANRYADKYTVEYVKHRRERICCHSFMHVLVYHMYAQTYMHTKEM